MLSQCGNDDDDDDKNMYVTWMLHFTKYLHVFSLISNY